jgi:hypothetical protein
MNNQHPIVPSFEIANQWHKEACKDPYNGGKFIDSKTLKYIATKAAQWGADQELEACCSEINFIGTRVTADSLRSLRRPKPPSLKKQALIVLDDMSMRIDAAHENLIRRALEALPND